MSGKTLVEAKVLKKSGDKTIKCEVARMVQHPRYRKYIKKKAHYLVHDEENKAIAGDTVVITEGRPRSARKSWVLVTIKSKE